MQTEIEAVMEAFDRSGVFYEVITDEDILEADRTDQPEITPRTVKMLVIEHANRLPTAQQMLQASPGPFVALRLVNEDWWYYDGDGCYLGMTPGLGNDFTVRNASRLPGAEVLDMGGAHGKG